MKRTETALKSGAFTTTFREGKTVTMPVINILKDGTVVGDMSKVTVPKEVFQNIIAIAERGKEHEQKENEKNRA